ncbi:hypothetical protein [Streptomyces sp. NPDC006879]|uniref:hypothetical protein n=1 Tax=Streptomyces sp. NPDC006879 TaxID=3364767 RepID=UPI0036A057E9
MKRLLASGVLCVTVALSLTACSSDEESPAEQASKAAAQVCTNLTTLKSDSAALRALNPASATKDQIKEANDAVQQDWANVKESLATLDETRSQAVEDATEDLKNAYEDLPGDVTGSQALTELQPQINALDSSVSAAASGLNC